jgi:hypothetical protein
MDPQGPHGRPCGPHSATVSAARPPAVAWTVADRATATAECAQRLEGHRAPPLLDLTARQAWV